MDLRVDRFIIENNQQRSTPYPIHTASNFLLSSGNRKYPLGTLEQISDRSQTCKFCNLVRRSVEIGGADNNSPNDGCRDAMCYASWEIDGRDSEDGDSDSRRTRRIRLKWDNAILKKYEAYIVLVSQGQHDQDTSQFLGKIIDPVKTMNSTIKSWLRLCEKHHESRCNGELGIEDGFREVLKGSYFAVIDIINMQLVSLPWKENDRRIKFEPFAALSYVWGHPSLDPYRTYRSNVKDHQRETGIEDHLHELPRAIQESIDLVRRIGIRYIWIDSLCIVQDSHHSFKLNARVMHLIYGNATITVCAADGEDSRTGLVATRPQNRPRQLYEDLSPGMRLLVSRPPEAGIRASRWNRRAWTFQERLLSRRCLIFVEGRFYFQCRSMGMSENIYPGKMPTNWSLDSVHAPLQILRELSSRAFWFYMNCVSLYTSRDLSNPHDILAAFTGIGELIQGTMQASFIFGLPSSHLDIALLWEPDVKISPREPDTTFDIKFPSWSWCGWEGATMRYKTDMVDGCLANVQEWLQNHTWIVWHIRDKHGNLRPLWNNMEASEDKSTETRWRGYGVTKQVRFQHPDRPDQDDDTSQNEDQESDFSSVSSDISTTLESRKKTQSLRHQHDDKEQKASSEDLGSNLISKDIFGRPKRDDIPGEDQVEFSLTLPDYPFGVRLAPEGYDTKAESDRPILQFCTWSTHLRIIGPDNDSGATHGLCRCDLSDKVGDWCGSIVLNESWISDKQDRTSICEFIALSEARSFTREECPEWTYFVHKEREESLWDLFYVLLVEYHPKRQFHQRVGLGKVFKKAFPLLKEWKEIILG